MKADIGRNIIKDKNTMDEIKEDQMKIGESGKMDETLSSSNKLPGRKFP